MNTTTEPPQAVYARYSNLWDYWLVSHRIIDGQRFVIEQYGKRNTGWPGNLLTLGTDYYVDGLWVPESVFDRALRLCSLAESWHRRA